jgi:hypothetical protein
MTPDVPRPDFVTSYDYGIGLSDGSFSIIIPMGTHLPLEPIPATERFYPNEDNINRLDIPVYCRDKSGDITLQGIVNVHLPPNIKKTTPVFVTFRIGQDGILYKAIVDIQDNKFEKDLYRGNEWTDKIERGLNDAENKLREMVGEGIVTEDAGNNLRKKIENVIRISMEGSEKDAIAELEKLMAEIENLKEKSKYDELFWKALSICNWTEYALHCYSHLLDPNEHRKMSSKVEVLRNVIKTGKLDKIITFENHPDIFVLMSCRVLEIKLEDINKDPISANKLRTKRVEFEEALLTGDRNLALDGFKELVNKMYSVTIGGIGGLEEGG